MQSLLPAQAAVVQPRLLAIVQQSWLLQVDEEVVDPEFAVHVDASSDQEEPEAVRGPLIGTLGDGSKEPLLLESKPGARKTLRVQPVANVLPSTLLTVP